MPLVHQVPFGSESDDQVPFGRTPPDASVTVPTIVAVCPKAERDNPNRSAHRTTKGRRLRCFRLGDGLIALADEEEFMY